MVRQEHTFSKSIAVMQITSSSRGFLEEKFSIDQYDMKLQISNMNYQNNCILAVHGLIKDLLEGNLDYPVIPVDF